MTELETQKTAVKKKIHEIIGPINDPKNDELPNKEQDELKALSKQLDALDREVMSVVSGLSLTELIDFASMFPNEKK